MEFSRVRINYIVAISLFTVFLVSCNIGRNEKVVSNSKTQSDTVILESSLEIEVLSQTLHRLVFSTDRPPILSDEEFLVLINDDSSIVKNFAVSGTINLVFVYDTLYGIKDLEEKDVSLGISTFLGEKISVDSVSDLRFNPNELQVKFYEIAKTQPPEDDCNCRAYGYKGKASISRILFNKSNTKAFFYFDFYCGCWCGFGRAIFAEKINGNWQIMRIEYTWIS